MLPGLLVGSLAAATSAPAVWSSNTGRSGRFGGAGFSPSSASASSSSITNWSTPSYPARAAALIRRHRLDRNRLLHAFTSCAEPMEAKPVTSSSLFSSDEHVCSTASRHRRRIYSLATVGQHLPRAVRSRRLRVDARSHVELKPAAGISILGIHDFTVVKGPGTFARFGPSCPLAPCRHMLASAERLLGRS